MSQQNDTGFLSIAAGAARSAFLRVYNSSGTWTTAGASNQSAGVQLQPSLAATDQVAIKSCTGPGTLKMTASGIIAVGGDVYAGATGKVAATGTIIEGVALEAAAADGDIIEVLPVHNRDVAAAITGTTSATFEVDSDAALAQVADDREGGMAAVAGAQRAGPVAFARSLDLDHVGTMLRQQHRAVGPGDALAEIDHL